MDDKSKRLLGAAVGIGADLYGKQVARNDAEYQRQAELAKAMAFEKYKNDLMMERNRASNEGYIERLQKTGGNSIAGGAGVSFGDYASWDTKKRNMYDKFKGRSWAGGGKAGSGGGGTAAFKRPSEKDVMEASKRLRERYNTLYPGGYEKEPESGYFGTDIGATEGIKAVPYDDFIMNDNSIEAQILRAYMGYGDAQPYTPSPADGRPGAADGKQPVTVETVARRMMEFDNLEEAKQKAIESGIKPSIAEQAYQVAKNAGKQSGSSNTDATTVIRKPEPGVIGQMQGADVLEPNPLMDAENGRGIEFTTQPEQQNAQQPKEKSLWQKLTTGNINPAEQIGKAAGAGAQWVADEMPDNLRWILENGGKAVQSAFNALDDAEKALVAADKALADKMTTVTTEADAKAFVEYVKKIANAENKMYSVGAQ